MFYKVSCCDCQNEGLAKKFDLGLEKLKQASGVEYEVSVVFSYYHMSKC